MSRMLRRFVAWLLIAVLPVQAYAMVTMVACGPSHERMAAATAQPRADSHGSALHLSQRDHAAHDHAAHDHHAATSHASDSAVSDDGARAVANLGDFKCSACAACCVGAALPAGDVALGLWAPSPDTLRPAAAAPLSAVALDGLERPPRTVLV